VAASYDMKDVKGMKRMKDFTLFMPFMSLRHSYRGKSID